MTDEDYMIHCYACNNLYKSSGYKHVGEQLQSLLGSKFYTEWFYKRNESPVQINIRAKLELLASPHWRCGLKMLEARGEIHDLQQLREILGSSSH